MAERSFPDALPADYRLHWYMLLRVLGQGGFGITYLARDTNLDQLVAIKEFLPVDMATRLQDASVRCRTDELRDRYRWGLERFIQEARTLARFDHANIVRVLSVFEANDTAYMVMRFEEGHNLASQLERRGTLPEPELQRILLSILDGLELVHNAGFIHRDIKPDNIHIRADGTPVLLDFGSARHAIGKSRTLTILVAPGYAPLEQYYSDAESQGPWTDIYGMAATCYRAIAGVAPIDAIARSKGILGKADDVLVPASVIGRGRYSERLLAAIDHGLAFAEKDRPQSIAEWRREILVEPAVKSVTVASDSKAPVASVSPSPSSGVAAPSAPAASATALSHARPKRSFPFAPLAWSVAGAAAAAISIAVFLRMQPPPVDGPAIEDQVRKEFGRIQSAEREKQRLEDEARAREDAAKAQRAEAEAAADAERKAEMARREAENKRAEGKKAPDLAPLQRPAEKPVPQKPLVADPAPRTPLPQAKPGQAGMLPTPPAATTRPEMQAVEREPPQIASIEPKVIEMKSPTDAERLAEADRLGARGDDVAAVNILRELAEKGDARAQSRLGNRYSTGRGVMRDDAAAVSWYRRAADQGDGEARLRLGNHFEEGRGVARDLKLAYVWYSRALRSGLGAAEEPRSRVLKQLQPAEIAQQDKLIENDPAGKERSR